MIEKNRIAGSNSQYIRYPFGYFVGKQKELGIDKIDLVSVAPHIWCDHLSIVNTGIIVRELKRSKIEVAVFTVNAYKYSLCAERNTMQREATMAYYINCINAAYELECDTVAITAEGACIDIPYEILWKNCLDMLQEICNYANKKKIKIVLPTLLEENSPILNTLDEVDKIISEINSDSLYALLDLNVISICGESISQWFERLGNKIKFVRFTDGNYNGYRVWGEGCLPCEKSILELESTGYTGILSMQMPGEKYIQTPYEADMKNLNALGKFLK